MRTLGLLLVGVVVGWAASGVDWTRDAVGEEIDSITGKRVLQDDAVASRPTVGVLTPTPQSNPVAPHGPRRVYETRMTVDAHGARHTEVTSRLVNPDGSIVPETPTPGLVGRYQVSAYGWPGGHGCYVVDTMTGKTWHNAIGQATTVAIETLNAAPTQNLAPAWGAPTPTISPVPSVVPEPSHAEPALMPRTTPPSYSEPHAEESDAPVAK